jgi:hypothetical protein
MGIHIEGIDELFTRLEQTGEKSQKGVFEKMKRRALKMQTLAKEYAPIDKGNLEDAIILEEEGGGRDFRGAFVRKSLILLVDGSHPTDDGRTVGDYAYEMHEYLTPYGDYKLGKKSKAKDGGRGVVGGKFLERAIDEVSEGMMEELADVSRSYY